MKWHEMIHKITWHVVQCMKCTLFVKCEMRNMRDMRVMHVICTMKCVKCNMKWCEMQHEMTWNATWNDVKCNMKWHAICNANRWFRLHATRCNLDYFNLDHNLIILFLILLKIWASVLMWNWLNKMSKICVYTHDQARPDHCSPDWVG